MKLYDLDHSPFAARVRIALAAKGLEAERLAPPGGALSDEFRAISPVGLVPALETGRGTVIPESEVIVEYLEDEYPEPPLRPADPEDRARARLLARLADMELADALKALFEETKRAEADPDSVSAALAPVRGALELIDLYLDGGDSDDSGYAVGAQLSTADCALVPLLFFVDRAAALFADGAPFASLDRLAAYWAACGHDPHVGAVLEEMRAAQARRADRRKQGLPED